MPRVSIGLPVFNGENYLAEAIQSVLEQSFYDLELIISDNASNDRTEEICRDYALSDRRIRYFRNPKNLGAAPNYNIAWDHSQGKYFKWMAHDDRLLPHFVENTVRTLDENPDAVLCNTVTEYIGADGEHLGYYRSPLSETSDPDPSRRLAAMILKSHVCIDFFGMVRRKAMERSLLHQAFSGADKAFLAQMALRGRMLQIEPVQVQMREHPQRYTRMTKSARMKLTWHDSKMAGKKDVPILTLYRTYKGLIAGEELTDKQRHDCRKVLRQFWIKGWNSGRLVADVLSIPFPNMVNTAFNIKYRLFGAPGNFHR
jgi:glycosyltransferase involved in cell wall biosynthesis